MPVYWVLRYQRISCPMHCSIFFYLGILQCARCILTSTLFPLSLTLWVLIFVLFFLLLGTCCFWFGSSFVNKENIVSLSGLSLLRLHDIYLFHYMSYQEPILISESIFSFPYSVCLYFLQAISVQLRSKLTIQKCYISRSFLQRQLIIANYRVKKWVRKSQ